MTLQIIETSETDSIVAVAQYVGELIDEGGEEQAAPGSSGSKFAEEAEALYARQQHAQLLELFIAQLDLVLSKSSSDQDLECVLNIVAHLVARIALPEGSAAAKRLAAALAARTDARPEKRLQTLVNLYNVVYDAESKLAVLLEALRYAKAAGLADVMLPAVRANAEGWAAGLGLGPAAERQVYAAAVDMLGAVQRKPRTAAKESYRLLLKLVASYDGAPPAELAGAKAAAAQAVSEFIRSPDLFTFDLAESPAVAQLGADPAHAPLHQLLAILLGGTVAQFQARLTLLLDALAGGAFADAQAALFERLGLAAEAALAKMRLLALMGLAHGATELSFADIQAALGLGSVAEVEGVVVQAIGKRILEARIDQLRGTVTVARCPPRTFGPAQWAELQGQLAAWAETVRGVREAAGDGKGVLALPVRA
eukprot:scaffold12.g7987.t1